VGTGNLGYGAVITHTVCADRATPTGNEVGNANAATDIESCYDLELMDSNGDGLTAPHSATGSGGLAGGFTLQIDYGHVVVEHRGRACPSGSSSSEEEWNECAVENGFGYCGVRVCTISDGSNGGVGRATVSNLSGSHCSLDTPQCDASSSSATSSSSIKVVVDTDSYADELSYEVRKSNRNDSTKMKLATQGELILAGGNPVYAEGTETVILGQLGVGIALADNESYESAMCLPDSMTAVASAEDTCYDIRAYDAYGDGMGCGADGSFSVVLETPDERYKLTQLDKNQAKKQSVEGQVKLACMNKEKLSKWSYCAVRVCADGTVEGLEGNQCDFGMGEALIDTRYLDVEIDPLQEMGVPPVVNAQSVMQSQSGNKPEKVEMIKFENFELSIVDGNKPSSEKDDIIDPTWAEYYENLQPGFKEDGAFQQPVPSSESYQDSRPNKQGQGMKGPRPNAAKLNNQEGSSSSTPKPQKEGVGQKGPRPNAAKLNLPGQEEDDMRPNSSSQGPDQIILPLKPFGTDLLDVNFPKSIKFPRPKQLSAAVATYLLETFAENDDNDTPTDFNLECNKSRERVGAEVRWHVDCDGTAVYPSSAEPPRMKLLNKLVRDAFEGKSKEDFLELMYGMDDDALSPSSNTSNNNAQRRKKKQQKRKKMMQRLKAKQAQMQQQPSPSSAVNINQVMNDKKQSKLDKKQAKQQQQQQASQSSPPKEGELNVMGYISGSQNINQFSSAVGEDGNIYVFIGDEKKEGRQKRNKNNPKKDSGGGGRHRMLRSPLKDGR
jgi:hypothetical protein